jgi:K+-sensing histidine kinase KdpD
MRTREPEADTAVALGGLLPIVVGALLVLVRPYVLNVNVALVLMATVVVAGSFGDRRAGVVAAGSAALSFNFFHTQPYLSLSIDSADDVETVLVLLACGLFVGTLAGRRRTLRAKAAASRQEISRLHRVADLIAHDAQPAEVMFLCERELAVLLTLVSCTFVAGPPRAVLPRLERNGTMKGGSLRFVHGAFALPHEGVDLPVLHRGQRVGSFLLTPTPDAGVSFEQRIVAVAIADQAGAVLGPLQPLTNQGRA